MANEKILVVDDDQNICELLRLYLTKEGYQVTLASDGEDALAKYGQVKPDMVLLDVMMPRLDGWEVCRRIRKEGDTPVIMLTAKGETFDKVLGWAPTTISSSPLTARKWWPASRRCCAGAPAEPPRPKSRPRVWSSSTTSASI